MGRKSSRRSSWGRQGSAAFGAVGVAIVLLAAASCSAPRTPAPPVVQEPTSALVPVPHPPPPARVEIVPDPPREDAVWSDGEWVWRAGRWAWRAGRWVVVPPGVAFAPWTTVRSSNGTLYVAEGTFRDATGRAVPAPDRGEEGLATDLDDPTPAGGAFVDAYLLPGPPPRHFPDGATPLDASVPSFRGREAGMLEDAMPVRPLGESRVRIDAP